MCENKQTLLRSNATTVRKKRPFSRPSRPDPPDPRL